MLACCHGNSSAIWRTALLLLLLFTAVNIVYLCGYFDLRHWTLEYFSSSNGTRRFLVFPGENANKSSMRFLPGTRKIALQIYSFPFPVEMVNHELASAQSTREACKSELKTLFLVHTAPSHFQHRRALRKHLSATYNRTLVFFIGLSSTKNVTEYVRAEARQHGDVVILPYLDAYSNLTYKFLYGIKWTLENCPDVKHVIKMDDDIVVNVYRLDAYLSTGFLTPSCDFHCLTWHNMGVIRDPMSPWYLSKDLYPKDTFPSYCSGSAVILPVQKLHALFNASFSVPFMPVDDVYVTGELARFAKVGHVEINDEYSLSGMPERVAQGIVTFAHFYSDQERATAWKNMIPPITHVQNHSK